MRGHRHYAHAVGKAAIHRLQVLVIEGLSQQHRGNRFNKLCIRDGAVLGFVGCNACLGVLEVFAAQAHHQVENRLAKQRVLLRAAVVESREFCRAGLFQLAGLDHKAVALGVEHGAHVSLGYRCNGAENALFAAARAGAIARHQGVVVGAHHEHVAKRRGLRVRRICAVKEAKILLRSIGQQVKETGAAFVLGVHFLGFGHHLECIVIAARCNAGCAALAQVAHKN